MINCMRKHITRQWDSVSVSFRCYSAIIVVLCTIFGVRRAPEQTVVYRCTALCTIKLICCHSHWQKSAAVQCVSVRCAKMPRIQFIFQHSGKSLASDATERHSTYIKSMLHTHCVVQEWRRALSLTFSFVIASITCIRVSHWRNNSVCGIWSVSRWLC